MVTVFDARHAERSIGQPLQERESPSAFERVALRLTNSAYRIEHAGRVAFGAERYCGIMDPPYRIAAHCYAASAVHS
jgi:hypothetical protein